MRFDGSIKSWNEDRGFGFIEPAQGGQDIFVHVKALAPRSARPRVGQPVSFEIELNPTGKKRARNVAFANPPRAVGRTPPHEPPARWSGASRLAIPMFVVVAALVAAVWRVPAWLFWAYPTASLACFLAYALDKSAARAGRWRTPESTLLALGLVGGWPGGLLAQQLLRHKTSKASFRAAFWGSVLVNVLAFVVLCSPRAGAWLG